MDKMRIIDTILMLVFCVFLLFLPISGCSCRNKAAVSQNQQILKEQWIGSSPNNGQEKQSNLEAPLAEDFFDRHEENNSQKNESEKQPFKEAVPTKQKLSSIRRKLDQAEKDSQNGVSQKAFQETKALWEATAPYRHEVTDCEELASRAEKIMQAYVDFAQKNFSRYKNQTHKPLVLE